MQKDFDQLFDDYYSGVSASDIFHFIFSWIQKYKGEMKDPLLLEVVKLEQFMSTNASIHDIVEMFLQGTQFSALRQLMHQSK